MFHRTAVVAGVLTALALFSLIEACNRSPAGPGLGVPLPRLELTGPATIAPGQTTQFRLIAVSTDGSSRDVSDQTTWHSSKAAVVEISATGRAAALDRGESVISANYDRRSTSKTVFVVPAGTYAVTGTVTESEAPALALGDARVQILVNAAVLMETVTNSNGGFGLYGVPAGAELRVGKEGYVPDVRRLEISDHTTVEVQLALARPRPDISGTYTLTLGSERCDGARPLPADLRKRVYSASVAQTGSAVTVTLSGPDFWTRPPQLANHFSGAVEAAGATFRLSFGSYYYYSTLPDITERLPNGHLLIVTGRATTSLTDNGLSGTLNGSITQLENLFSTSVVGVCTSTAHPFTLSR